MASLLAPIGWLSAPLPRANWLKDLFQVSPLTSIQATCRKQNIFGVNVIIPINLLIKVLNSGGHGSAKVLNFVAGRLTRHPGRSARFFLYLFFNFDLHYCILLTWIVFAADLTYGSLILWFGKLCCKLNMPVRFFSFEHDFELVLINASSVTQQELLALPCGFRINFKTRVLDIGILNCLRTDSWLRLF